MKAHKKLKKQVANLSKQLDFTNDRLTDLQHDVYPLPSRKRIRITDKHVFVTCVVIMSVVAVLDYLNIQLF